MSHLKLYCPNDEPEAEVDYDVAEFPATIPFDPTLRETQTAERQQISGQGPDRFRQPRNRLPRSRTLPMTDVVSRARVMYQNQSCPFCQHVTVEPIELGDAMISRRNHRPIPGTATVVGFHCHSCGSEWPAYNHETA